MNKDLEVIEQLLDEAEANNPENMEDCIKDILEAQWKILKVIRTHKHMEEANV